LLNIQPETPREYGHSLAEHYVTLDFTGWRDFEMPLRERDAARYCDYEWPYKGYAVVFHRLINGKHVSAVNFYLNEIPAGGKAEAEVSDIVFVPLRQLQGVRSEVVINGKSLAVPFEMQSGDFAELEDGVWTLYSPDGDPMRRVFSPDSVVLLQSGVNEVVCRARGKDGTRSRMEVTIFAVGAEKNAFQDFSSLAPEAKKLMSYEAAEPQFYAPGKGFAELSPIMVRSGERAKMEVTLYGPMSGCTLNVAGVDTELPAVEKGKHRRFTLAGEYSGVCPVKIAPKNLGECEARFEFAKRYR
jgi:hypothetical protein